MEMMTNPEWLLNEGYDRVLNTIEPILNNLIEDSLEDADDSEVLTPALNAFSQIMSRIVIFNQICLDFEIESQDHPNVTEKYSYVRKRVLEDLSIEIKKREQNGLECKSFIAGKERVKVIFNWADLG